MTLAARPDDVPGPLEAYRGRLAEHAAADEFLDPDGAVREGWGEVARTAAVLGARGLAGRADAARRLAEDDGVTYGGEQDAPAVSWRIDPLPVVVGAAEWAALARGLEQRTELLDLVLSDLYGERRLLAEGLLPPETVFAHDGFLRAADGLRLPGPRQLVLAAADLVRGPDGWRVLGDRTQAPSGAGYAMENRRIVARVLPGLYRDTPLQRLRSFFHAVRDAVEEAAPRSAEAPKVVILTPGPAGETAYDQAFLAGLLGYQLVEGRDLTVRDGRVWLRSLGRAEPVDVVVRRVDAAWCDPLELRPDSYLGVPGLLEAARLGHVSIVNTPGAGVLENPALVAHLPAIARALLGEELALPSVRTWWCGDPAARRHVLAHLAELVVRPISRGSGRANRFGWELSAAERDELGRRIEAEPHAWCAQEALAMSSVPAVLPDGGLEPRRLVLRSFAVAAGDGYRLMDGGLGRIAARPGALDVSSQAGAVAKDVWVLQPALAREPAAEPLPPDTQLERAPAGVISSRVAEDMFWLGRYAERAEDAARLIRVVADVAGDHANRPGTPGARSLEVLLRALTRVTTTYPGFALGPPPADPLPGLVRVAADAAVPGTLAHAVRHTVEAAQAVREQLSTDTWLVLGSLDRTLAELSRRPDDPDLPLLPALARVLEGLLAFAGLGAESLVRDAGWYLFDAGRRVERGLQAVALLRHALAPADGPPVPDDLVLESVLIAAESVITHRRRRPGRPRPGTVLGLLLLDADNPRALAYQVDRLAEDVRRLPPPAAGAPDPAAAVARVRARLAAGDPAGVAGPALAELLDGLAAELAALADAVEAAHFARTVPPQPLPVKPALELR